MNYVLQISIEGADKANASLDNLVKKVGSIGGANKISFNDWLDAGSEYENQGEKIGKNVAKGVAKGMKAYGMKDIPKLFGDFMLPKMPEMPGNFFKGGSPATVQKSMREAMDNLAKQAASIPRVGFSELENHQAKLAMEDARINEKNRPKIKGLRDVTGADLAKVSALGDINEFGKKVIKGLRTPGGADLAKVQSLPDINSYNVTAQGMDKKKMLMGAITGMFNPWIGSRLMSDAMPKGAVGAGGVAGGIFGAGGAMGFSEFYLAIKGVKIAFDHLCISIENARKLYAKSLTSGMGVGFTVKYSMIADVLGVSEQDIFKYGAAIQYLNKQLEFATQTTTRTLPALADVGIQAKIFGENMKAMFAEVASGMAPMFKSFLVNLNDLMVTLGKSQVIEVLAVALGALLQILVDIVGGIGLAIGGIATMFKLIADGIDFVIAKVMNMIPGATHFNTDIIKN